MTALATLLLAGSLASSCPKLAADPSTYVPDQASVVLGVDVDGFVQTSIGRALVPALRADLQLAEALEILEDCGLSLERTYALVLARDFGDGRMAVLQSRKLGAESTLACLADELRARSEGGEPWTPVQAQAGACHPSLELSDGSQAWVLNDYTVVWARGAFVEPVAAKLEGRSPLVLPASLTQEFARLDRSGQLWLAAQLDDASRRALPGRWAASAESLTAAFDLSEGLRAVVSLTAADVSTSANLRNIVLASFADLADRLDAFGVRHRLRERARVGIVDQVVVAAELVLDEGELREIRGKIGEQISGRGPL